jgi:hypothetical protein
VEPGEILDQLHDRLKDMVLVGDDFAGYFIGFRAGDSAVIEVDMNGELLESDQDFATFIRVKVAEIMSWVS